jgi:hypothetical protein
VDRLAVRPAGGRFRQDGGIHVQDRDRSAREAGTNLGTIAWATAVTYSTGRRSELTGLGQPALTPEGATMATDAGDHEQQRRELEEIRRQFAEVGKRTGSAFEPASPDENRERSLALVAPTAPPDTRPAPPDEQPPSPDWPTRPRWQWLAAVALIFVFGIGLGYALRAGTNESPPPPSTARPPVSTQPQQPQAVPSVPEVCLETARRGDQMVHLFTINDRSRRLALALKAYTLASQACRKEASP